MIATVLEYVVATGIVIYGMRRFLVLRKYWQYRHTQVATDSISVIARMLSLGASLPFLIKFVFVDNNAILTAKELVDVTITGSILLVGAGLWVEANRGLSPLRLVIRAVNQERREAIMMNNRVSHEVVAILNDVVGMIRLDMQKSSADSKIAIDDFAAKWNLGVQNTVQHDIRKLTQQVRRYLAHRPPLSQIAQLSDTLLLSLFFDEANAVANVEAWRSSIGQLQSYLSGVGYATRTYEVVVVTQNQQQVEQVRAVSYGPRNGGFVYTIGGFYAEHNAEKLSLEYVKNGFFSIVEYAQFESIPI
jgi:hypothetical protein